MAEPNAAELALRFRAKHALRGRLSALRRAVPAEARQQRSDRIVEQIASLPEFAAATWILGYAAMRSEVQADALLAMAANQGKHTALPRVERDNAQLGVHQFAPGSALTPTKMGFRQPRPDAPVVAPQLIDLVVIPALAADERGHRLGFGKGYYDRLLPTLTRACRVVAVFDFQLLAELPNTPGDHRADLIVTDTRVLTVNRNGEPPE